MTLQQIMNYAAQCEQMFEKNLIGERKTTFFYDLSLAECYGEYAIKDTDRMVMKGWIDDIEYITEYSIALNHKIWQHWENNNKDIAKLYDGLWKDCCSRILEHYKNDQNALRYYYDTTD